MELKSSAFSDGGKIPVKYIMKAIGGENISPGFEWSSAPDGVKSFAFSIVDPHPVANNWVHWFAINIPANSTSIAEGASGSNMPPGSLELNNTYGSTGYGGPQPPEGSGDHPYDCTIYALSVEKLNLEANTTLSDFQKALEGNVLDKSSITGKFGR